MPSASFRAALLARPEIADADQAGRKRKREPLRVDVAEEYRDRILGLAYFDPRGAAQPDYKKVLYAVASARYAGVWNYKLAAAAGVAAAQRVAEILACRGLLVRTGLCAVPVRNRAEPREEAREEERGGEPRPHP